MNKIQQAFQKVKSDIQETNSKLSAVKSELVKTKREIASLKKSSENEVTEAEHNEDLAQQEVIENIDKEREMKADDLIIQI